MALFRRLLTVCFVFTVGGCGDGATGDTPDLGGGADMTPGPIALAAGEAVEVAVKDGVTGARLATPAGTEKFMLIVGSSRFFGPVGEHAYSITLGAAPEAAAAPTKLAGCSLDDTAWKSKQLPKEDPPTGPAPMIGEEKQLWVAGAKITAKVVAVGDRTIVWEDVALSMAPNKPLDKATIDAFLPDFDNVILPRARTVFGVESDVDKNGRIGLVFTPRTKNVAVAFFTGCDLKKLQGCGSGNAGEYLYLTPPSLIQPPYNTPAAIKETVAHELGHLVHFNRKVLRNSLVDWLDSGYMIEGFGAFAQDSLGFQSGNLYVTKAGLDEINDFSLADTVIDGTPYDLQRDGPMRGGSFLFVRWLYDRAGGDIAPNMADRDAINMGGMTFIRALLDAKEPVSTAITTVGGAKIEDVGMDFFTALGTSNRGRVMGESGPTNTCFAYRPTWTDPVTMKQHGVDVFVPFHGQAMSGPLTQTPDGADKVLRAGGVEYVEVEAAMGATELAFTVNVDPEALPRVRIARVR